MSFPRLNFYRGSRKVARQVLFGAVPVRRRSARYAAAVAENYYRIRNCDDAISPIAPGPACSSKSSTLHGAVRRPRHPKEHYARRRWGPAIKVLG